MNNKPTQLLPAVAAIIFNEKGEVLLQKRRDVNKWGLLGGHVEFGETVEEAICREIFEETGTSAFVKRMIGVYSSPSSQTYEYADRKVQYITTYFEAMLNKEITPGFSNNETMDINYFPVNAIPVDLALVNPYWLQDALDKQTTVFIR